MAINFMSSKDNDEEDRVMHLEGDKMKITIKQMKL